MRLIVNNPKGGAAIWQWRLDAAIRELQSQQLPNVLVATEANDMAGPVRRALATNPGVTQIVACGGDGTVAACAAALDGRDIPIGIIPTGTSNVLAFELGLPSHAVRAARTLNAATKLVPFRTWNVNGQVMLLQLGIGFDGRLLRATPRSVKRALGFVGVAMSAFRTGVVYEYPAMRVTGELETGQQRSAVVTSAMVANCKRWAGSQIAVPTADPNDDFVDVLLLQYRNFLQLAAFWFGILLPGSPHLRLPYVEHVRLRRLHVEGMGEPVPAHIDGEPILETPIDVQPLGRVHLLAPA
jgi:diacylglycerol kinase family enzyme